MAWRRRRGVPTGSAALLGSGALMSGDGTQQRWSPTAVGRAEQAWAYYGSVPELHYGAGLLGSMLSMVVLRPLVRDTSGRLVDGIDEGGAPVDKVARVVAEAIEDLGSQADLLRAAGTSLVVEGETRWLGTLGEGPWAAYSTLELRWDGQEWSLRGGPGGVPVRVGAEESVVRIWRPSPSCRAEADSPVFALLDVLSQMVALSDAVTAACMSRSMLGLLRFPAEVQVPLPRGAGATEEEGHGFQAQMIEVARASFREPRSASRWIPITVPVPSDMGAHALSFVSLAQNFTDFPVIELIDQSVRRFARGMDWPVEVTEGHQQTTFANAAEVRASLVRDHVEPAMVLVTEGLTAGYLGPYLEMRGLAGSDGAIGHSSSALMARPDSAELVPRLVELDLISPRAAREATGFTEDDAPTAPPA